MPILNSIASWFKKAVFLSVLLCSPFFSFAQTIIPDLSTISGNWTISGSPYIVLGRCTIPTGQTLIIDPGVQVRFASNTALQNPAKWDPDSNAVGRILANGKIIANGTVNDTISFLPNNSGYWGSIAIVNDTGSSFTYCKFSKMNTIENHSIFYPGLWCNAMDSFNIQHCLFENNQYSINSWWAYAIIIGNSVFKNNVDSVRTIYFSRSSALVCNTFFYNSIFDNSPFYLGGDHSTISNSIIMNADTIGLFLSPSATMTCNIVNTLFYNNPKPYASNVLWNVYLNLYNNIFLNNTQCDTSLNGAWLMNNCNLNVPIIGTWSTTTINYGNTNPSLINPIPFGGDFHLTSSSICINSGDTTGISQFIPLTDLDGNPRYVGTIDIGPYEYQGSLSSDNKFGNPSFKIFPNPANNFFQLTIESEGTFKLTDILGNNFKEGNINTKNIFSTESLPNGIYFISVNTNNRVHSQKLIIQH